MMPKAVVRGTCKGFAFHLAMQEETLRQFAVGHEHKLAEVRAVTLYHVLTHIVKTRYADDHIALGYGAIAKTRRIAPFLLAVDNQRADILAHGGIVGSTGVHQHTMVGGVGFYKRQFCLHVVQLVDVKRNTEHRVCFKHDRRRTVLRLHAV